MVPISRSENNKIRAFITYQEALNELSIGQNLPAFSIPQHILAILNRKSFDKLSAAELDALAKHYYQEWKASEARADGQITRSTELWTQAKALGSVEAKYNLARCVRNGEGVTKDAQKAFVMFSELAKDHDHPLAHV
jgi:TPR repeat protein